MDVCCNDTKSTTITEVNKLNAPDCSCANLEGNKHNTEQPTVDFAPTTPIPFFTSKEEYKPISENPPVEHTSPSSPLDKNVASTEEDIYNLENPSEKPTYSSPDDELNNSEKKHTTKPPKTVLLNENENLITTEATGSNTKDHNKCGSWNRNGVGFRIVNAIDGESQYGEFPSMIAILKEEVLKNGEKKLIYHCGGSLIEKNVVLTAAHCVIK